MTTTLTLTPDADTASVLLTAATDATGVTITRTDQNGVAPVRLLAGQQLGQAVAIRDYEPALVGPVRYTCTTTTAAELRRNHVRDPRLTSTGYAQGNATASRQAGGGVIITRGANDGYMDTGAMAVTVAAPFTLSMEVAEGVSVQLFKQGFAGLATTSRREGSRVYWTTNDANVTSVLVRVRPAANSTAVVDRLMIERTDQVTAYFDGAAPGAEWTGTANASPSVIRGTETVEQIVRFDEGAHEVAADVWSVVERPQYGARGRVTLSQSLSAADRSTRHDIIGRPDPVFIMQRGGFRTGTVEVLCLDVAAVDAFYQLQGQAGIVQVRTAALSPGQRLVGDLYVKVTGVSSDTVQGSIPWRFRVRLDVAEVRRPTGPLLGAAVWTYAALPMPELGLTYEGLPRLFATYNDLAAGVRIDA